LAIGFIAYDALKILRGHAAEVPWLLHVLAALFVLRFVYLAVN
jgi:AGZA family xanthine/uracil permease-like MFS transporter